MAKKRRVQSVDWLVKQIDSQLKRFGANRENLTLRQKVVSLVEILQQTKDLGVSVVVQEHNFDPGSAMERIRLYLVAYVGEPIRGEEIEVVSGISEYGRRVRQLRSEDGYQIASGASPDVESGIDLRPDEYLLVDLEPDREAAQRWHRANRIRKLKIGSSEKIRRFLLENVGRIVTTDELHYVSGGVKEFGRRTRELRTEGGYAIFTKYTGRPDLRPGQYVLESSERVAQPHDRRIPTDVQKEVYRRDQNKCRVCGWTRDDWSQSDPRYLELHHIVHHADSGPNVAANLLVLCSRCHDDLHAGLVQLPVTTGG